MTRYQIGDTVCFCQAGHQSGRGGYEIGDRGMVVEVAGSSFADNRYDVQLEKNGAVIENVREEHLTDPQGKTGPVRTNRGANTSDANSKDHDGTTSTTHGYHGPEGSRGWADIFAMPLIVIFLIGALGFGAWDWITRDDSPASDTPTIVDNGLTGREAVKSGPPGYYPAGVTRIANDVDHVQLSRCAFAINGRRAMLLYSRTYGKQEGRDGDKKPRCAQWKAPVAQLAKSARAEWVSQGRPQNPSSGDNDFFSAPNSLGMKKNTCFAPTTFKNPPAREPLVVCGDVTNKRDKIFIVRWI